MLVTMGKGHMVIEQFFICEDFFEQNLQVKGNRRGFIFPCDSYLPYYTYIFRLAIALQLP